MWLDWIVPAVAVLALDQTSKALVVGRASRGATWRGPRIRLVRNPGIGLGVRNPVLLALAWAIAAAGAVALLHLFPPFVEEEAARAGLGAAVGGSAGNLIDRVCRGGVIDFIDLRIWPAFNLADVAIIAGVMVALASTL